MSEPVLFQHVIIDDDQDHSAPTPCNNHFGYCGSDSNGNGNYSPEWEHMYGDLVDENHHHDSSVSVMHDSNGEQGQQQQHETVFLFDFEEE